MNHKITRRDFLDGVLIAGAASAVAGPLSALAKPLASPGSPGGDYYPPLLTGLRGSHKGAYEVSHALAWRGEKPAKYQELDEAYDLIIVGAGISGLAAALFYQQQAGAEKRILILDNHDDFGGHAKRNEFNSSAGMLLGPGGSLNLENYQLYSAEARGLIERLGFDLPKLRDSANPNFAFADLESRSVGLYADHEQFGEDKIVNGHWIGAWLGYGNYAELITELPLQDSEKETLRAFVAGTLSLKKTVSGENLADFLTSTSYLAFLTEYVGLQKSTAKLWNTFPSFYYGVGVDSVSIAEAMAMGCPASSVLGDEAMAALAGDYAEAEQGAEEGGVVWLPDGNATLVRQMVRKLIPQVAPGTTVDDLITARFDYGQLDRSDRSVRLRLNSSVVGATNDDEESVSVSYVNAGKAYRVRGKHCVLACYNGLIPHLCPELPESQKENLRYGVKVPLVVANVMLRNGRAFQDAGSGMYLCPTSYFAGVTSAPNTALGDFAPSSDPDDPMILYLLRGMSADNDGSQTARDLYRIGRHKLYTTSFADYEREIRDQLTAMFGPVGFDADKDIEAITVNRWSHGYAYEYMNLFDPQWPPGEAPHELGRKQFGRISIANSDSEAYAYVNAAIDAAWRAVAEQVALS